MAKALPKISPGDRFGHLTAIKPDPDCPCQGGRSYGWVFECALCGKKASRNASQVRCDAKAGRLRRCRCQMPAANKVAGDARRAAICKAFVSGNGYAEIGREFGISRQRAEQIVCSALPLELIRKAVEGADRTVLNESVIKAVKKKWLLRLMVELQRSEKP